MDPPDGVYGALPPCLEIAVLVKDSVVGQVVLVVDPYQLAIMDNGSGVVEVLFGIHKPHHASYTLGVGHNLLEVAQVVLDEVGLEEEVFRRVTGEGQLGEGEEVHPQFPGPVYVFLYSGSVAAQVTNSGVYLAQAQAEGTHQAKGWADTASVRSRSPGCGIGPTQSSYS